MKTITCFCGTVFKEEIKDEIDLTENPEIVSQILDNSFMNFTCPDCGKVLKPEFPVKFTGKNLDLQLIPEIERDSYLTGKKELSSKQIVIGIPELREKFLIYKFDLDDRVIELIKLYLLKKAGLHKEITILFEGEESSNLIFYIFGLKEGETGISKIPGTIYTDLENNLEQKLKEPGIEEFLSLPYRSVTRITAEV